MNQTLLDRAPCGYLAFSDDGALFEVNETLASILNYSRDSLIGKNVESIFTISTRIFYQTHLFPLVKLQGYAEEIYITILASDGTHLPVLLNAKRLNHGEITLTSCVVMVVPNRKKFEDELVLARKGAENALKENTALKQAKAALQLQTEYLDRQMEQVKRQNHELKQFNHVVTHNLKEPLRKILLFTDKLKAEVESPTLTKLLRSSDQLRAVVGGLQQYLWLNEKVNEFSQVNLGDVVSGAAEQIFNEIDRSVLRIKKNELHELEGDQEQLQLLFYHLLSNAVKFKRSQVANVSIQSTIVKRNVFRSVEDKYKYKDYIRLEFKDDGIGFDGRYREHIFELFRKLDLTPGQGLGLALCRKIAENHFGFIEAESEMNAYTRIIVWLPLVQQND
ncbi:MAG: PAS domain S-box protein [Chitinophagaceae bacterium]|nr:MAG: PAS domain S-box protein [Chitinophagaceae bacterium]